MKIIKLMLAPVAILIMMSSVYAQQEEFGVQAISNPDGILLIIGGEILHPTTADLNDGWIGYNIYRQKSGKSKYDKVNEKPLSRVDSIDDLEKKLGIKTQYAIKFLGLETTEELWEMLLSGDQKIMMISILDLSYREILGLSFQDRNVKPGISYSYVITRVNSDGKESERSAESIVTFGKSPFDLKGPLNVIAEADEHEVRLSWQVNPADTGVFSYSIYRTNKPAGPFDKVNDKPVMIFGQEGVDKPFPGAFTDSKIKPGLKYYYAVVSVDIAGNESEKYPLVEITPGDMKAPAIPQNIKAKSGDPGITLTWDIGDEADLAGYNIFRSQFADSQFVKINNMMVPPDTGLYYDHKARAGVQYYYRLTARDRSGNQSQRSARVFSVYENSRGLLSPQAVGAAGTREGVTVTWERNSEPDLQGYYVFRGESATDKPVQVSPLLPGDTTGYHDKDKHLSPKGNYWYYVQAINYSGYTSELSTPATASPDIIVLPEPPLSFYGYQDLKGNRLFWDLPFDNTVVGYYIYRAEESISGSWLKVTSAPVPGNIRTFTDTTAENGVTYRYQIRSVNANGAESKPSHSVLLNIFTPPPLPPGGIMVTSVAGGLKISWDKTMEGDAVGYYIYRRIPGGRIERITRDIIDKSESSFVDGGSVPGKRYYYSVSCLDEHGREGARSAEQEYFMR